MTTSLLVDANALPPYDLGPDHPFARDRQRPLFDLLDRLDLVEPTERLRPGAADRDALLTAHDPGYLEAVEALSAVAPDPSWWHRAGRFGLGTADNPIHPGQHDGARAIAGATLACVERVMAGAAVRAFNPAGGLHHAMPAAASGFCIYNDLVVGIRAARRAGAARVLYVDFDVHHGDGVQHAFWDDPTVVTLSFHEDPAVRWPFTRRIDELGGPAARGTAVNVPLASGTEDASWLEAVTAVLPPLARRFRPDLIVSQHGCDPHRDDPLADLSLGTGPMIEAAAITRALADELCAGRWVATGGGGYRPIDVTPRVWGGVWAVLSGRPVPERVPDDWRREWVRRAAGPLAAPFVDPPMPGRRGPAAAAANRTVVAALRDLLGL